MSTERVVVPTAVFVGHLDARGGRIRRAVESATSIFQANGYHTVVLSTTSPDHDPQDPQGWGEPIRRYLADSTATPPAVVVAVGGDGTAHLVLNVIMEYQEQTGQQLVFGLVASGSGNDLARHWGSPRNDPPQSAGRILRRLSTGVLPMDLGRVDGEDGSVTWFATALCAGIDAAASQRANTYPVWLGSAKYLLALGAELIHYATHRYGLEITGSTHATQTPSRHTIDALMVNVANTSSVGGGLKIVPQAEATDAALDLFVVHPLSRAHFVRLFPLIFTGRHVNLDVVETRTVTHVRITGEHAVYVDGDRLGRLPITVSVCPHALLVAL